MKNFSAFLIIVSLTIITNKVNSSVIECLIENERYSNEYLLTKDHELYTYNLVEASQSEFGSFKWILIQLPNSYDVYYLRNNRTGEYVCVPN